jgi:hypothetical protein
MVQSTDQVGRTVLGKFMPSQSDACSLLVPLEPAVMRRRFGRLYRILRATLSVQESFAE